MLPDYRGGLSYAPLRREGSAWLADTTLDALYVEPFQPGFPGLHPIPRRLRSTARCSSTGTATSRRRQAAGLGQFRRTGPGLRIVLLREILYLTFNLLRGAYL